LNDTYIDASTRIKSQNQLSSFFSRFKTELLEGGVFEDIEQARSKIFSYIEDYYKRTRLHSALGYKRLMEFEMELKTKN
jgi:transposase InsO family protein